MQLFHDEEQGVLSIAGADRFRFLQGLITQDISLLESKQKDVIYTAMLSPQGRYLFDFFIFSNQDTLYIIGYNLDSLLKKLLPYKLRLDVQIHMLEDWKVFGDLDVEEKQIENTFSFTDPRLGNLCHWYITLDNLPTSVDKEEYVLRCYELGVPNTHDLTQDKSIILEWNFEELNGISFKKGCYMGQELMSRTKHVGEVRKRIFALELGEEFDPSKVIGEEVLMGGQQIGTVQAFFKNKGLAMIRLEKLNNINNKNNIPVIVSGVEGVINFFGYMRNEG